ncbi:MAG: WD40/YVTN/BNR-like repeat-containing protein [Gemmatimonadota bacterium]
MARTPERITAERDTRRVVLLVGTRMGLFTLESDPARRRWEIRGPDLAGYEIYHAIRDARDPRWAYAAARHSVWGVHLYRSADGGRTWDLLTAPPHYPAEAGRDLRAIWFLAPGPDSEPAGLYAGIEPAGLFVSRDRGETWSAVDGLNEHPTNATWQPAGGGLALHSIAFDPRDPAVRYAALSAGGAYRSDDGGRTWAPKNAGVRADFLPAKYPESGQCVHKMVVHPANADRLYQQNHCGTYRSDDRGDHWEEITSGLPSDFGYPVAVDPSDPDAAFVIPEQSSHLRTTVDGRLRVYRTRDAGRSWTALARGLPQENVYVTVLREAMATDALDPCGVYFGTSSGHLFASRNAGESWAMIAGFLPRILSVEAAVL